MLNPLMIGVLIIIIGTTIHGYRKGFLKILISILSLVLTIWLVAVVTPYISTYLVEHTGLYDAMKNRVAESLAEDNARLDNTIPENQTETINSYEVPNAVKTTLINNNTEPTYTKLAVTVFEDYVSSFLARLIINIAAFVCTFIMITVFLRMTFFSLELISKIPIIKGLNKLIGLVAGFAEGILIVWVFFLFITIFAGGVWGSLLFMMIDDNILLSTLYNTNILLKIISALV